MKKDNFLVDAVKPDQGLRIGYRDGFRFGFGFFISGLLVFAALGGITWGVLLGLKLV